MTMGRSENVASVVGKTQYKCMIQTHMAHTGQQLNKYTTVRSTLSLLNVFVCGSHSPIQPLLYRKIKSNFKLVLSKMANCSENVYMT
jgi:hypothetical protein